MKASSVFLAAVGIAFLSILVSCSTLKPLEYKTCTNFTIDNLGFTSSSVKMNLVYFNPNRASVQFKKADIDLYIDSVYLGHTSQDYQITIPKDSTFSIPIKMDVDMKNLLRNAWSTVFKKEFTVIAKGSVKIGKFNVFINFPVNYEGKQQLGLFQ